MTKKKSTYYTLETWEKENGELTIHSIREWIIENNLSPRKTRDNIEEFRLRMEAKGLTYANFAAAFKVWFRRGWLAYSLAQAKNPEKQLENRYYDKGVNL